MVLKPQARGPGARHLREVGAGFRRDRPPHRYRPSGAEEERQGRRRHAGRSRWSTSRRCMSARGCRHQPQARHRSRALPARLEGPAAPTLETRSVACSRPRQQALGVGAVRSPGHGPHRAAPRRRRRASVRSAGYERQARSPSPSTARRATASPIRKRGGAQAVAETWRNLTAVGAKPLAITDNMNFGNPQRPEIMGQFVGCIEGMRRGLHARSTTRSSPATSRSTTRPTARASCPPRSSAASALIDGCREVGAHRLQVRRAKPFILIGETTGHLGQLDSICCARCHGREEGRAAAGRPQAAAARNGDFIRTQILAGQRDRLPRPAPTAACWWRSRRWRMAGNLGAGINPTVAGRCPSMPGCSAKTRRATSSPWAAPSSSRCSRRPRLPACRRRPSGQTGGAALTLPEVGAISVARLRKPTSAGCRLTWARPRSGVANDGDGCGGDRAPDQARPLPGAVVVIEDLRGDGDHYAAHVTASQFAGMTRIQQHQMVLLRSCAGGWAISSTPSPCRRRYRNSTDGKAQTYEHHLGQTRSSIASSRTSARTTSCCT